MSENHKLNKDKIYTFLLTKGWRKGLNNEWIIPQRLHGQGIEDTWTEAILQGIECKFEKQLEETKEFLRKHPTQTRNQ